MHLQAVLFFEKKCCLGPLRLAAGVASESSGAMHNVVECLGALKMHGGAPPD